MDYLNQLCIFYIFLSIDIKNLEIFRWMKKLRNYIRIQSDVERPDIRQGKYLINVSLFLRRNKDIFLCNFKKCCTSWKLLERKKQIDAKVCHLSNKIIIFFKEKEKNNKSSLLLRKRKDLLSIYLM